MSKWYVTIDKHSSHIDDPDECVWTVSRDLGCTGWNTDSGHSGYGLTKADAEELANAANEIERLRAALRPFARMFLYPDDLGFEASSDIKEDPDWDNDANDMQTENCFVLRRDIKRARAALGEAFDDAAT
jgi:hypothetical protein